MCSLANIQPMQKPPRSMIQSSPNSSAACKAAADANNKFIIGRGYRLTISITGLVLDLPERTHIKLEASGNRSAGFFGKLIQFQRTADAEARLLFAFRTRFALS